MLRTIGCTMILCAGALLRQAFVQSLRHEEKRLRACIASVAQMELEVRLALTPMVTIVEKLARSGDMAPYFERVRSALRGGQMLHEAWEEALPYLCLGTEAEDVMRALGQKLSGDEETVCRALTAAERALEEICLRRQSGWSERRRLSGVLCFSAAALTIIVLL